MSATDDPSRPTTPSASAASLRKLVDTELSMGTRLGLVALLLGALTMTAVVSTLWATEPVLPQRTGVAFALMIATGVSWVIFAIRALTHRRILLARHRIIAGRMSVTFTTLFVLGAFGLGSVTGRAEAHKAGAVGILMLAVAVAMLVRAHRSFAQLSNRRDILERELDKGA